jgi:hypothetical protein
MIVCRFCTSRAGSIVLDAGRQPAGDHFPAANDPGPDPLHPLRMWMCDECGLAQLTEDPTVAEEPRGREPEALVLQAQESVSLLTAAGDLGPGISVAEFGSPHGGSWRDLVVEQGAVLAPDGQQADVVIDNIGMMHSADQAVALRERVERLAPGGTVYFHFHSLATIIALGQWNALRHGHYAYYSTPTLVRMLETVGLVAVVVHRFPLYGGTVLLGARREAVRDRRVDDLVIEETAAGVLDPAVAASLQTACSNSATALAEFVRGERAEGRTVAGYSAASRAVALLCNAGLGPEEMPMIADASREKQGRSMPGSRIPIAAPDRLVAERPDTVVLFVPDLLEEVRRDYPEVEAAGGRWVVAETLNGSGSSTRAVDRR